VRTLPSGKSAPAMQLPLESLRPPLAFAARRQSANTGRPLAQHCAAMPVLFPLHILFCPSARPTEEVMASSPGHKQKSGSLLRELPGKMAMPASGILSGGDGG